MNKKKAQMGSEMVMESFIILITHYQKNKCSSNLQDGD